LQELFFRPSITTLVTYFKGYDLVFIDEAQNIPKIGLALKLLVDNIPEIRIIATGSSSFDLSNKIGEPLVGRQTILRLFPVALLELENQYGWANVMQKLEDYMIYGTYPEVLSIDSKRGKIEYLNILRDSYLLKDLFAIEHIKNAKKIRDLLRLLAYQVGNYISVQELGRQLEMSKNTVARYLDLLEKAFILINIRGFSRNLRKEISKTSRYYFYDNGVLNAVINNFNSLNNRDDVGRLWENFMFIERMKKREYKQIYSNTYFWRTYDQQEIDLIEERDGNLFGFEFKFRKKNFVSPKSWKNAYPESEFKIIHKQNMKSFVV
jgi:predicted AAA+ superfamily ATPase